MNLREEITRIKAEGYSEDNSEAKLCQDIILKAIFESGMVDNATIKGGVVMRSLSNSARRATQDIDLDLIRHSISDDSIKRFISKLNCIEGIEIKLLEPILELKHKDYSGKRVMVQIIDSLGTKLSVKMDIGVHKDYDVEQKEYAFSLSFQEEAVCLFINSKEQILVEKLKSLIRFGARTSRYKDIFDIYYLSRSVDNQMVKAYIAKYIFGDNTLALNTMEEMKSRIENTLSNPTFLDRIDSSKKNWLDIPTKDVVQNIVNYLNIL